MARVVLEQAFLRRLVVVRRDGEDAVGARPLHPQRARDDRPRCRSRPRRPAPAPCRPPPRRPARRRGSRSSSESVGLSPVVPHGTRKCTPPSICRCASRRTARSSIDPSRANGVTSAVPQPVQFISCSSARVCHSSRTSFIVNHPRLPLHPARGLERAAREDAAIARRVGQRDRLAGAVEPDGVRPGNGAGPRRGHVDGRSVPRRAHRLQQRERGTRRRILLGGVMELVSPRTNIAAARQQLRGTLDDGAEQADPQGEIRCGDDADAARVRLAADCRFVRGPAGRADHDVEPARGEVEEVDRNGFAGGKINRDVSRRARPQGQRHSRDRPTRPPRTRRRRSAIRPAFPFGPGRAAAARRWPGAVIASCPAWWRRRMPRRAAATSPQRRRDRSARPSRCGAMPPATPS